MSLENIKKPLISILMAVYNPNYEWFKEQLISLNNQTYDNIELIIYDDCSYNPVNEDFLKKYINNFSYHLVRGKVNLGSNKAFEKLTQLGQGVYFAYCDQDDIWKNNKIEELFKIIQSDNSILAYSDMAVIDKEGNYKYSTLLKAKPRIKYISGENLLNKFFFKNCVSGCCMLIKADIAKSAIPFSDTVIHDQWLCIIASLYGKISFINESLVMYRIHGNNQTGSLKGIMKKDDYYKIRVFPLKTRLEELNKIIKSKFIKVNYSELNEIYEFCEARINKRLIKIFKYRSLCKKEAYFEIAIKYVPNIMFKYLISILK